jgi:hypothetical protein
LGTVKPKLDQIERLDKHIHRADRIILVDSILKALRHPRPSSLLAEHHHLRLDLQRRRVD